MRIRANIQCFVRLGWCLSMLSLTAAWATPVVEPSKCLELLTKPPEQRSHFIHVDGPLTATHINARQSEYRARKQALGAGDRFVHGITWELAHRAPPGGWTSREAFILATRDLFGRDAADLRTQEEAWRVYDLVRRDRRTPLIATFETYQAMGIFGETIRGTATDGSTFSVEVNHIAGLTEAAFQELRNSNHGSAARNVAMRNALDLARNQQWLWSEYWSPVINDFYVLGIIHGHDRYQFLAPRTPTGAQDLVRVPASGRPHLTTTAFELTQLLPYFDPTTFRRRPSPIAPYSLP